MKKRFFLFAAIYLVLAFITIFIVYTFLNIQIEKYRASDLQQAAKIETIRKNKNNWQLYTNSEQGFSLLLPPDSKPRDAPLRGVGELTNTIEYEDIRLLIIPVIGAEDIDVGIGQNFRKVKKVQISQDRTEIQTLGNITFSEYAQETRISLKNYNNTKLVQLNDGLFYYPDGMLYFRISGGRFINFAFADTFPTFPFVTAQSEAAIQVKQLELDILKTVQFFRPSKEK